MMNLKPRSAVSLGLGVLGLVVLFAFQNCGTPFSIETEQGSAKTEERDTTFDYPYSSKPEFYSQLSLYKAADEKVNTLTNITFIGTATYAADPLQPITYRVTIKNPAGQAMCPTQTGTLAAGSSNIQFGCVTLTASVDALIEMEISAAGKTTLVKETFHNN